LPAAHTDRHAMNLVNLRFHPRARFFWDERGPNLEEMVLLPIENSLEMGQKVGLLPEDARARSAVSRPLPRRIR
jgi:cytochrome c peroxidase